MVSTNQAGNTDEDEYERADEMRERIGVNPARWLDCDLIVANNEDKKETVIAFIKGMDYVETVNCWKQVEKDLGRGEDGGPREKVMELLNNRLEYLIEHGEREERVTMGPRQSYEEFHDEIDRGSDEGDKDEPLSATQKLERMRS